MLFVLFVLIFGFALGSVEDPALSENVDLPESPDAELSPEMESVMLEMEAQGPVNVTKMPVVEEESLVDLKSLVTSMTKGDAKLTAFIVGQLLQLKKKTYAEHKIINARVARKLKYRNAQVAAKRTQDKLTSAAVAAYAAEVIISKYELLQVNREVAALDRISAKLNSMIDWKSCPRHWKKFGRSCYRRLGRSQAWQAEARCLKVGGSLIRVDNTDDKNAVNWYGRYVDNYLFLGFFRSLKTGQYQYLDGTEVTITKWYHWYSSYHGNKAYNYVRYYYGYRKILGCHYSWSASPLCEHRLAVNLLK